MDEVLIFKLHDMSAQNTVFVVFYNFKAPCTSFHNLHEACILMIHESQNRLQLECNCYLFNFLWSLLQFMTWFHKIKRLLYFIISKLVYVI